MATNIAIRPDDGRRTKYRNPNNPFSVVDDVLSQMSRRSEPLFNEGQIVYTPNGYKQIVGRYHTGKYWMYRIWDKYSTNFKEDELMPLFFTQFDYLTLPTGIRKVIHNIHIAPGGTLLFTFEIRPKQYTVYNYTDLLKHNPPMQTEIIQYLFRLVSVSSSDVRTHCKQLISQIVPLLAI